MTAAARRDNAEIRTGRLLVPKNAWCFEGADAQHTSGVLLVPKGQCAAGAANVSVSTLEDLLAYDLQTATFALTATRTNIAN